MSAPFRAQIQLSFPEAQEILANQIAVPVLQRPPNQCDSEFFALIHSQ